MKDHPEEIDICPFEALGCEEVIGFCANPRAYGLRLFCKQAVGDGVREVLDDEFEVGKGFC